MTSREKRQKRRNRLLQLEQDAKMLESGLTVIENTDYQQVSSPGKPILLTEYTISVDGECIYSKSSYCITPEQEAEGILEQQVVDFLKSYIQKLKLKNG